VEHAAMERDVVLLPLELEDQRSKLVVRQRRDVREILVVLLGRLAGALEDRALERRGGRQIERCRPRRADAGARRALRRRSMRPWRKRRRLEVASSCSSASRIRRARSSSLRFAKSGSASTASSTPFVRRARTD
jgi:hypothetical protein